MKRFLLIFAATFALSMFATSCDDSGDLEDNYLPPSVGIDTSYSPNIVAIVPGYERVEVIWELNNIENEKEILASYIYWNGGKGVHEAVISKLDCTEYNGVNYYRQIFDIPEGDYSIFIRNLDSDKYVSAESKSLDVSVYGAVAQSQLMDRPIKSATFDSNKIYTLTWDECETCAGSTITYTKSTNQIVTEDSPADAESVALLDAVETGDITIETVHLPSRTVVRPSVDADDALSLEELMGETYFNVAQAGLDTIAAPAATKQMLGDGTKFYYVTTWDELWELLEAWETDFRTEEEIAAGADIVSYKDSTAEGREANLARKSNVNLKMLPGRYIITQEMAASDYRLRLMNTIYGISQCVGIPVTGNNNYFDFTDVVFVANTDAIGSFNYELFHLYVIGDANTIVGGSFNNEGSEYDDPNKGETNVVVDGRSNLLLNTRVHVMGSKPFGYGEMFGKGATNTISHNKHCGLLVRGNFNVVKRCTLTSRSYGHLTFFQGGYRSEIVESKVQGAFSTTDAIWEEEGFGTAADLVDFMTAYFYKVPRGYALPLTEDSYRTYTDGSYWMRDRADNKLYQNLVDYTRADGTKRSDAPDGNSSTGDEDLDVDDDYVALTGSRNTTECIIEDSEVIDGRGGVAFRLGSNNGPKDRPIRNITLRGAQGGISSRQSGTIEDCRSDIKHGPVYGQAYATDSYITADITFIPYVGEHYNYNGLARDNGTAVKIKGGTGLKLTFPVSKGGEYGELFYEDNIQIGEANCGINSGAYVQCAGNEMSYGELAKIQNEELKSSTIKNESYYPLRLGNKVSDNDFYVRVGSYIAVEDEYGQRLDPNNDNESAAFWAIINDNDFYLHSAESDAGQKVKQNGGDFSFIPCPNGTKGVWVVKVIDVAALRKAKGFPIYHNTLVEYIKNMDNAGSAGGGLVDLGGGQSY